MKINQVLMESTGATVAFAFGRFNPAHQGHIEVWRAVEDAGANWFVGTNPNTIGPNDPLTFEQKSAWMEEIYPPITGHIVAQTSVLTLAAYIFKKLRNNERATVAYITDATDWAWSGKLLNQYNGVEGSHGYYKFAQITHQPSPRVSSATALRDAARANDRVAFYDASGTDPKLTVDGLSYFDTVKQACEKYPLPVKRGQKVKEGYYDRGDYYNAHKAGEYGKGYTHVTGTGGNSRSDIDDILKGKSKHLPADPFSRTSGVVPGPESKQGQIHRIALPGEMGETVKVNFRNINNELGQIHSIRNDLAKVWLDDYERFVVVPLDSLTPYDQGVTEDDESSEVKKQGQLIPWPAGTTKVHVSDVYDWYKLGMVISDLDDADPKMFGQGAPQSIIAFGSEEEESKLLPLLKRLGLRVDDIDPEGTDEIGEAYHAGALYEYLNKASIKENASRMISAHDKNGFITVIIQAPDGTKKALTNDNPRYINQWLMRYDLTLPQSITKKFKHFSLTEFAPSDDSHGDEKSYLLQLADDLFQAIYVARNKMAVKAVKDKIIAVGGDVKIVWNKNGSFNVVMFHPVHFKQGHLVSLVGDSDSQRMGESTLKEINRRDLLKGISAVALGGIDANAGIQTPRCTKWTYYGTWPNQVVTCVATDKPPEEKKPNNTNPNVNPNISTKTNTNPNIKLKKESIEESNTTPSQVEAWGYRYNERDQRVMWRLNFDSEAAAHKWANSKNATVLGVRPVNKLAEEEQKTMAKTWDQMSPQEKSSGVKGRTLWNEKTQRYYTVFDVPVNDKEVDEDASLATMRNFFAGDKSSHNPDAKDKRFRSPAEYEAWLKQNKLKQISGVREDDEIDEASLKTMRDFFAGDKNARDPFDITTQRLHFSQDPEEDKPTKDVRFRSPAEYEEWLVQNKLKKVSGPTVPPNDKVHQLQGPAKPKN